MTLLRSESNDRTLNHTQRNFKNDLSQQNPNIVRFRERSPLLVRDDPAGEDQKFFHLKRLLSNANLQNNKNYLQYSKAHNAKKIPNKTESLNLPSSSIAITKPQSNPHILPDYERGSYTPQMSKGRSFKADSKSNTINVVTISNDSFNESTTRY